VEVVTFDKILGHFSPIVPPSAAGFASVASDAGGLLWRKFSSKLRFDVPLATALCKNLPAENAQRQLSRPKPTRVVQPTEEEEEDFIDVDVMSLTKTRNIEYCIVCFKNERMYNLMMVDIATETCHC
jgi:hypothetical protein